MSTVVYKYRGPERISDLRSRTIRLTPPGEFNDPFEALPAVSGAWSPATLARLVSDTHAAARKAGAVLDDADVVREFQDHDRIAAREGAAWISKLANELFGVVSLSEIPDDPLMWGHYGQSHTGFVIGFRSDHPCWERQERVDDPVNRLVKVRYSSRRPAVKLDGAGSATTHDKAQWAADVFGTKSRQWSYEREVRLISALSKADQIVDHGRVHLLSIPAEAVVEVIFGLRMGYADTAALHEVLDDPAYRHVQKRKASLSQSDYAMSLTDL